MLCLKENNVVIEGNAVKIWLDKVGRGELC